MRVMATVERHEVSVEIGPEEIADALLDGPNEKCTWVLSAVGQVLRAISDWQIREQMNDAQRRIAHEFLAEQAKRYAVPEQP